MLVACAGTPGAFPELSYDDASRVFVTGIFVRAKELQQFPECLEPGVLCADPAPFSLVVRNAKQLFGESIPRGFEGATTSHWGISGMNLRNKTPRLFLLLREGEARVIPKYSYSWLGRGADGEEVLPIYGPYSDEWLPCTAEQLRSEIQFDSASIIRELASQEFEDYPELYVVNGRRAIPKYGIRLEQLAEYLSSLSLQSFQCN